MPNLNFFSSQMSVPQISVPQSLKTKIKGIKQKTQKLKPSVNLSITVDRTPSSEPFAKGVIQSIASLLDFLDADPRIQSGQVWLWSHGDLDDGHETLLLADGKSFSDVKSDLPALRFDAEGKTLLETHLDAIHKLSNETPFGLQNQNWNVILGFMTSESKPAQNGLTPAQIGKEILDRKQILYLVAETTPRLYDLVVAAQGKLIAITPTPSLVEMQALVQSLGSTIIQTVTQPQQTLII